MTPTINFIQRRKTQIRRVRVFVKLLKVKTIRSDIRVLVVFNSYVKAKRKLIKQFMYLGQIYQSEHIEHSMDLVLNLHKQSEKLLNKNDVQFPWCFFTSKC